LRKFDQLPVAKGADCFFRFKARGSLPLLASSALFFFAIFLSKKKLKKM
jgi:hypothetical protein